MANEPIEQTIDSELYISLQEQFGKDFKIQYSDDSHQYIEVINGNEYKCSSMMTIPANHTGPIDFLYMYPGGGQQDSHQEMAKLTARIHENNPDVAVVWDKSSYDTHDLTAFSDAVVEKTSLEYSDNRAVVSHSVGCVGATKAAARFTERHPELSPTTILYGDNIDGMSTIPQETIDIVTEKGCPVISVSQRNKTMEDHRLDAFLGRNSSVSYMVVASDAKYNLENGDFGIALGNEHNAINEMMYALDIPGFALGHRTGLKESPHPEMPVTFNYYGYTPDGTEIPFDNDIDMQNFYMSGKPFSIPERTLSLGLEGHEISFSDLSLGYQGLKDLAALTYSLSEEDISLLNTTSDGSLIASNLTFVDIMTEQLRQKIASQDFLSGIQMISSSDPVLGCISGYLTAYYDMVNELLTGLSNECTKAHNLAEDFANKELENIRRLNEFSGSPTSPTIGTNPDTGLKEVQSGVPASSATAATAGTAATTGTTTMNLDGPKVTLRSGETIAPQTELGQQELIKKQEQLEAIKGQSPHARIAYRPEDVAYEHPYIDYPDETTEPLPEPEYFRRRREEKIAEETQKWRDSHNGEDPPVSVVPEGYENATGTIEVSKPVGTSSAGASSATAATAGTAAATEVKTSNGQDGPLPGESGSTKTEEKPTASATLDDVLETLDKKDEDKQQDASAVTEAKDVSSTTAESSEASVKTGTEKEVEESIKVETEKPTVGVSPKIRKRLLESNPAETKETSAPSDQDGPLPGETGSTKVEEAKAQIEAEKAAETESKETYGPEGPVAGETYSDKVDAFREGPVAGSSLETAKEESGGVTVTTKRDPRGYDITITKNNATGKETTTTTYGNGATETKVVDPETGLTTTTTEYPNGVVSEMVTDTKTGARQESRTINPNYAGGTQTRETITDSEGNTTQIGIGKDESGREVRYELPSNSDYEVKSREYDPETKKTTITYADGHTKIEEAGNGSYVERMNDGTIVVAKEEGTTIIPPLGSRKDNMTFQEKWEETYGQARAQMESGAKQDTSSAEKGSPSATLDDILSGLDKAGEDKQQDTPATEPVIPPSGGGYRAPSGGGSRSGSKPSSGTEKVTIPTTEPTKEIQKEQVVTPEPVVITPTEPVKEETSTPSQGTPTYTYTPYRETVEEPIVNEPITEPVIEKPIEEVEPITPVVPEAKVEEPSVSRETNNNRAKDILKTVGMAAAGAAAVGAAGYGVYQGIKKQEEENNNEEYYEPEEEEDNEIEEKDNEEEISLSDEI